MWNVHSLRAKESELSSAVHQVLWNIKDSQIESWLRDLFEDGVLETKISPGDKKWAYFVSFLNRNGFRVEETKEGDKRKLMLITVPSNMASKFKGAGAHMLMLGFKL